MRQLFIIILVFGLSYREVKAQDFECLPNANPALENYYGDWAVDWEYRTAPDQYETTSATSSISESMKGCGLREMFVAKKGDQHYFYDWTIASLEGGEFSGVWFDSSHGDFMTYDPLESVDGWPVQLIWHHSNGRMKTRFRYSEVQDGQFTIERHLSTNGGASWALTSRAAYSQN